MTAGRPRRTRKEEYRRHRLIRQHVALYGWMCPGYNRPWHPSTDLTADHLVPVARGVNEEGPIRVLCRSCNGRRGAGGRDVVVTDNIAHPALVFRDTLSRTAADVLAQDVVMTVNTRTKLTISFTLRHRQDRRAGNALEAVSYLAEGQGVSARSPRPFGAMRKTRYPQAVNRTRAIEPRRDHAGSLPNANRRGLRLPSAGVT